MNVKQILVKARALIANGWTQNEFVSSVSLGEAMRMPNKFRFCYCATGAIGVVGGAYPGTGEGILVDKAIEALAKFLPNSEGLIPDEVVMRWNDEPGRTKEEVVALFDKAIANSS